MSPGEKLRKFEEILRKQTGKSFHDFGSIEEAIASLSFRLNNEQIMANLLETLSEDQRRIVQMWRQVVPATSIATSCGFTTEEVEKTINMAVNRLREEHFTKFLKGWTLDQTGEPTSPDQPSTTANSLAEQRFQEWLLILSLKQD